ncbi:MAG TPA: NAD(P)/FAD-dependent oxidoreductase [Xanthobacteraceae bacterium]
MSPRGTCDLLIVGGSFAGLVAARTAAMRGLDVVVLEAKREAGARVATTGILVKEAAEEIDVPHHLTRRVHGVRLHAPSLRHIDLFSPGSFFLTTDTAGLLRWLAREAERAGARIHYGTRFAGAAREGSAFRVAGLNLAARYILGADGARSAVARHFGLGRNTHFLVGVEAELEGLDTADPRFLHCFLDGRLAPGYLAWVASGPRVTQVGLAAPAGRRADLQAFLARAEPLFGFSRARIVERRAGRIPAGGLVHPWSAPGVLLVGDAAGMVSPATGGGIRLAFQFGRRAAQAIADHLLHLGPAPETVLARELPRFALKRLMRMGLDLAPPDRLVNAAIATPLMRWLAAHVYFHRRSARGISFTEFEARIAALAGEGAPPGGPVFAPPSMPKSP